MNTRKLLDAVHQEEYGLVGTELALSGAIKYYLSKFSPEEAREKLKDHKTLLTDLPRSLSYNELETGSEKLKRFTVDFVNGIDPEKIINRASDKFMLFLHDCEEALRGVD